MIGPALDAKGGIASVLQSYRQAGLFERCNVRYACSYEGAGALRQLRVFAVLLIRLLGALLAGRVSLLHLHSASRGSFWRKSLLAAMAQLFRVPYVFHVHSGELLAHYQGQWSGWRRAWASRCLRNAARLVLLTPGWQRQFEGAISGVRCSVVRNPVDVPAGPRPQAGSRELVLFLGRLTALKGAPDLVKAFALVRQQQPSAQLLMAGPGDQPGLLALMLELGLPPDSVRFLGWIDGDAKQRALSEAGLFVLPSQAEGLPISILEAMASGLVVVATRVGGIPELIEDGRTGLLVAAGDKQALAEAMLAVMQHVSLADALADAAFAAVQPHAASAVVAELCALYRDLGAIKDGAP
jgi:glycosyltransferase involved in cell wall biosynthesis